MIKKIAMKQMIHAHEIGAFRGSIEGLKREQLTREISDFAYQLLRGADCVQSEESKHLPGAVDFRADVLLAAGADATKLNELFARCRTTPDSAECMRIVDEIRLLIERQVEIS